ncbi:MAG TPA: hypothetical protein DEF34_02670 [Desulfotomaculum sp.]|nr:hypothetical protein [Desulfotomaculum sp.]
MPGRWVEMSSKRLKNSKTTVRFKVVWSIVVSLVLVISTLAYYHLVPVVTAEAREVMSGISVQGVDLSNLERREGVKRLAELESGVRDTTVNLLLNGTGYGVTLGELGVAVDRDKTMDRALAMGNELGAFKRWYAEVRPVDRPMAPVLSLNEPVMREYLQNKFGPLEKGAQDAYLKISNEDQVEVVPAVEGYSIDIDLLTESLVNQFVLSDNNSVNVPVKIIQPVVTTEQVREWGVTGLVAEFSTRFNPTQANRNHNIATAAGKMDGWMVQPGEVFSFNKTVGSRGVEQGYRMANVIVGNKLEEDLGGGVCQVSTTLYNAVLLANLAVEQRSNHSIPISYVPVGRDAAVAYDYLDLKFKNNLDSHVLIKSFVRNSDLTVKIYGAPNPDQKVQIKSWITKTMEPETVYEIDPAVEPGNQKVVQKGASGYNAAAERLVLVNGLEVKRELLFGSKYQPVEHIVAVHSEAEIPRAELDEDSTGGNSEGTDVEPTDDEDEDMPADDNLDKNPTSVVPRNNERF